MSDGFKNLEDDILLSMVMDEDVEGNYQDDLIEKLAQDRLLASIDTKTGAPGNVIDAFVAQHKHQMID